MRQRAKVGQARHQHHGRLADAEEKHGESRGVKKLEERMARIEVALERIGQKLENISSWPSVDWKAFLLINNY